MYTYYCVSIYLPIVSCSIRYLFVTSTMNTVLNYYVASTLRIYGDNFCKYFFSNKVFNFGIDDVFLFCVLFAGTLLCKREVSI